MFKKPLLQFWPSSFNISLVWFLNLFGAKVMTSSLPKVQQAPQSRNFREKLLWRRAPNFVWNESFIIGLTWTHNHLAQCYSNFQLPVFYWKYSAKIVIKIKMFRQFWFKAITMESNNFFLSKTLLLMIAIVAK